MSLMAETVTECGTEICFILTGLTAQENFKCTQFIMNTHLAHLLKYVVLYFFLLFSFSEFSVI